MLRLRMSDSATPNEKLSPLARSILSVFDDQDDASNGGRNNAASDTPAPAADKPPPVDEDGVISASVEVLDDVAWVAETGGRFERDPDAAPTHDPLMRVVATYMRAEGEDRRSREPDVREAFTDARSREADQPMMEAIEALVRAGSRDPETLELARESLTLAPAKLFAARLTAAVGDEREHSEISALVVQMGPMMAQALGKALDSEEDRSARRVLIDAIVEMGDDAADVLERMVNDNRWFVVRNGVAILGQIGDETSVEHLTRTLADKDARVRKETINALSRIGGENAGLLLTGKLEDADPSVRAAAARAVGVLKVEKALKPLLTMIESENDEDVIIEVARALGQLGDPSAVNPLAKHAVGSFFSRSPTVIRVAAYQGLAGISTPGARQHLDDAAEDKDAEVRHVVRQLIRVRNEQKEENAPAKPPEGPDSGP